MACAVAPALVSWERSRGGPGSGRAEGVFEGRDRVERDKSVGPGVLRLLAPPPLHHHRKSRPPVGRGSNREEIRNDQIEDRND